MLFEPNPRAVPGDNTASPEAREVTTRLQDQYADLIARADAEIEEARSLPSDVEDEAAHELFANKVVALRDTRKALQNAHDVEANPYLRAWQAVNGIFNKRIDTFEAAIKSLTARVGVFQRRKADIEKARRQREEDERRRAAEEAAAKAAEEARIAEEARLAAERARAPAKIEAKVDAARKAEIVADVAKVDSMMADDLARSAAVEAARKPADMARSRFDEGRISTLKTVGYVEIVDRDKLDLNALRPFIKDEALLSALRQWAKISDYKTPMDGAIVEKRAGADIR